LLGEYLFSAATIEEGCPIRKYILNEMQLQH
jgi:hypothetical protein